MKAYILLMSLFIACFSVSAQDQFRYPEITPAGKGKVNRYVDNTGYWNQMIRLGYVLPGPVIVAPPGKKISARIDAPGITPQNSPDIPVTQLTNTTQSENSIFIAPDNEEEVLNSNNSSSWANGYAQDAYGADGLYSFNQGLSWAGSVFGAGEVNKGDPSTAISLTGRWFVGKIGADWGQSVAWSDNKGQTWNNVVVAEGPSFFGLLDKNHLWIDNALSSPFQGNLYVAWTNFIPGSPDTNQVQISRSTDNGLSWTSPYTISFDVNAGKLNHGVNLHTGPEGEVYAAWSIYDTWPSDEQAIGFCKSIDGGGVFTPATRIINNIKGIRASMTGKQMRVNAFPSMAVDISTGPYSGTIYLVFTNIGYPGINTGNDMDIYMIKSSDEGETWSLPVRVNQDPAGLGKQHFFPWITCDPVTGGLCVIFYDDRNVGSTEVEVFVAWSYDGGLTWNDFRVSDFSFTPAPIPGLAVNYFGDYIGIQSRNMKVYPVWTDNRSGSGAVTYVSPFDLGPNPGQPWVVYYSSQLAVIPATDNTGFLDYGDSLWLSLGMKNIGDQTAEDVTVVTTTSSPYITFSDSLEYYGNLDAGEIRVINQGFSFKVSDTIPDNHRVLFKIRSFNADSSWFSHFSIEARAPALKIMSMRIIDTAGNNNGRLDPGESVTFRFIVTNAGDFSGMQTFALLMNDSEYLDIETDSIFLDTLAPGVMKTIFFNGTVGEEVPTSTGIDLVLTLRSGLYSTTKSFRETIGLLVEDWETNSFLKFPWTTGGSQPWFLSSKAPYEGIYCIHSGPIGNSSTSQIWVEYTSSRDDSISFYLKTSTEEGYDLLIFYIDNIPQGNWSGETAWRKASFPVTAGSHTFRWSYFKDLAYVYGQDKVWIDYISFPPPVLPEVNPGSDDTICAGETFHLQATISGQDSLRWTTSGDGVFDNDTTERPSYFPGPGDRTLGQVRLKVAAYGQYGSVTKGINLTIGTIPVNQIQIYPNDTVCAGSVITLTADTSGITSLLWMPGGLTTYEINIDTSLTGGLGTHLIRLVSSNSFGCQTSDSAYVTFRDCTLIEELSGFRIQVNPNPNHGDFDVVIRSPVPEPIEILLSDPLNRLLSGETLHLSGDLTRTFRINNPVPGIYLLRIKKGDRDYILKVMVLKK